MNGERRLVYLVGEPGAGKSTIMDRVTDPWPRHCIPGQPRRELLIAPHRVAACELGARAGRHPAGYPGTDALPMNAVVAVEEWLRSGQAADEAPLILAEGARLAVRRFLDAAVQTGWRAHVILLNNSRAAANRAARGSNQNPTWIKGAATRAHRFWTYAAERVGHDGVASASLVPADDLDFATAAVRAVAELDAP